MKLIFLDIDGVLNSQQWHESEKCQSIGNSIQRHFDPYCIELLNQIVSQTQAKVIISSSWRFRPLMELKDIFTSIGFNGKIYGKTPMVSSYDTDSPAPRGMEIQEWIEDNQRKFKSPFRYAILDDEQDFLENQQQHFFQTNPEIGLDLETSNRVIAFFE